MEKAWVYKKQNTGMRSFSTFNYQFSKLDRWTFALTTVTWYPVFKLKEKQGSVVCYFPDKAQVLTPFVTQVCKTPCAGFNSKHDGRHWSSHLSFVILQVHEQKNPTQYLPKSAYVTPLFLTLRALQIQHSTEHSLHAKLHNFIFSS